MIFFLTLAIVFFLSNTNIYSVEKGKHLFILSGQSNMARLKPEVSFTPTVEARFGQKNTIVIKDAKGGEPIKSWYKKWKPVNAKKKQKPTGLLYDRLMKLVKPAIKDTKIATITFVWMQGERDAKMSNGDVYESSLKGLFVQLSEDLRRKDIRFVIGRISDFDLKNKRYPHWTKVRKAIEKVGNEYPRSAWINTDDLNDAPNSQNEATSGKLHYTQKGYKILGERFANKAIELIENKKMKNKKRNK